MNRSCNSILCRFGIHTADPYVHIQVKCRNGSHRWQSNYESRLRREERSLQLGWSGVDCDGSTRSWEQGGRQR